MDIIKIGFKEIGWNGVDCILVAMGKWQMTGHCEHKLILGTV